MNFLNRLKTPTLVFLGTATLAVGSILQQVIVRTGHSNDYTDFGLGVLLGIGIGLLMFVAWRIGRGRGASTGANTR